MMEKKETIRQNVEALCEMFGEDDAVLIVAHTGEPLGCVRALKGVGKNILTALSFAMMEDPDLLQLAKMAIGFVEHETRNKKN